MKHTFLAIAVAAVSAQATATDVGISVTIGQPGFYGRIDIGDYPPPVLVYPEPVLIQPLPPGVVRRPVYLHVPPGHAKDWRKHCRRYDACARPVYFVQESWYNDVYVPHYRERHGKNRYREDPPGKSRGKGDPGGDRGRGKGKGHD